METAVALKLAFKKTLPVLCGYLFMGMAFGILLNEAGYGFLWAFFISLFAYSGSMQFVLVEFLISFPSLVTAALTTLLVNARHIFYGLNFTGIFRRMGKAYPYMIFSLTDETYSVNCAMLAAEKDEKYDKCRFFVNLLDHCYWVTGCTAGCLIGELLPFDFTGVEFAMTALFVTIVVEQWLNGKTHFPAVTAVAVSLICLALFGADAFLLPALILISAVLTAVSGVEKRKEKKSGSKEDTCGE